MGLSHSQPQEMVVAVLVLFVLGLAVCPPPVFDDYFNEDVKIVDVSQDSAIKACVSPSTPLVTKISRATKACLGGDDTFDWEDFSRLNEGADTDNNGLTVKLENAETCFYGEMGWLVGGLVKKDVILSDFGNLNSKGKGIPPKQPPQRPVLPKRRVPQQPQLRSRGGIAGRGQPKKRPIKKMIKKKKKIVRKNIPKV